MYKLYQRKPFQKLVAFLLLFALSESVVYAQPNIPSAIGTLYQLGLPVAILIGFVLIALSGYKLLTSDGDPRKVQEAKESLMSAIMGLVFVVLAIVIYRVIVNSLIPGGLADKPF